ncbi:MAG: bifunctional methylenetetrahydrofolate dehydrogenase/methenyltetrahydrofolate cyclohydrolase FolD [Deltaproteobacteria bacterium]|nr:bifunctional methylenetetrahydrofolate dehydrogenase/methenyltetrahydrofolate cyclohydrolase FolD [Deltaproteobacteria bacterium]
MAQIIDGKKIALQIREGIKRKALALKDAYGITPGLAVVLVGSDPASEVYVRNKKNACAMAGFYSQEITLPSSTTEAELLKRIVELNSDNMIHGILVQLPLPKHISPESIIEAIVPHKDVDGFHPYNIGRLFAGLPAPRACTPAGIVELLDQSGVDIAGKRAVIIGRSNIVGKPLSLMLLERHATVTICHSRTVGLPAIASQADLLIAAIGKANFVGAQMVKNGAVVVDVGVNRLADGSLVGDVDFHAVSPCAAKITPVPGGVGPMTIAMLLKNTLMAAELACLARGV